MLPLVNELSRRRVFRALVVYGAIAFAILQIIEPVMHGMHWPDAVLSYVVVALALGFPVVVGLAWVFDINAGGIERSAPGSGWHGPRMVAVLIGIGVLAAAPGILYYFVLRARPAEPPAKVEPSIAVLPFADMSPQKDQEYFSDGLAEEILNALAQVEGLHVAGRASSLALKGKNEDFRTIGQKLNVGAVLEGSVRKSGNQLRITTQLISTSDGYHLWSETYERKLADVFAVQDEIANAVVGALKLKLVSGKAAKSTDHRTANLAAYNQYLLARHLANRGSKDSVFQAIEVYKEALALDPGYAAAWAGLARTFTIGADFAENAAAMADANRKALAAAEKAVSLAPDLPEALAARANVRMMTRWDWRGARIDLEHALAINPGDSNTQLASGLLRASMGELPAAIAAMRKATELDTLSAEAWWSLGFVYLGDGQLAAAREASRRALEIAPDEYHATRTLGFAFMLEGQPAAALAAFQRSTEEIVRMHGAALVQRELGDARNAQQALDIFISKYGHNWSYQIGEVYAWHGEYDHAFEWFERAYQRQDFGLQYLKFDPLLRGLRQDPRYAGLLKKMNLPVD